MWRSTSVYSSLFLSLLFLLFFFNDTATTEIYTLSLHDALPIFIAVDQSGFLGGAPALELGFSGHGGDRKSTRLNSSHVEISYAVFCLKKKKNNTSIPFIQYKST